MKILSSRQIKMADGYTIENEPISSIDLMERACKAFCLKLVESNLLSDKVSIFCGTGNNGADGLAIARMMLETEDLRVFILGDPEKGSKDFLTNLERLPAEIEKNFLGSDQLFPTIDEDELVIDALFGSGLSRPVEGLIADLIDHLNTQKGTRVSVDIATGLMSNSLSTGSIFHPHATITFQCPKLSFLMPGCYDMVGEWYVANIRLDKNYIDGLKSDYFLSSRESIAPLVPQKGKFDNKGTAGKLFLISGSKGTMGASVLSAKAAMHSGLGLLIVHAPSCGLDVLQISVPEAMVSTDVRSDEISEIEIPPKTSAVACGPGIGTKQETAEAIRLLLIESDQPMVLDADALNIIAGNDLMKHVPNGSILTPHLKEFERLAGSWSEDFQKLEMLQEFCRSHQVYVVLKGAYSAVCSSQGEIHFNPTGNPGMATAGSGDVLTGIIGALLAQNMDSFDAARLGTYIHGLAGDIAEKETGKVGMTASSIVSKIPHAFIDLIKDKHL